MSRPAKYATQIERVRAWKEANPEKVREHNRRAARAWKLRNPEKVAAGRAQELALRGVDREAIYLAQRGRCAICQQLEPDRQFALDHDHRDGWVRGLLCHRCNIGLGMFEDDPERLARAAEYLSAEHRWGRLVYVAPEAKA
jgi:hypothetical protein